MPPDPNVHTPPSDDSDNTPPWENIGKRIWKVLRSSRSGRLVGLGIVALIAVGWLSGQLETFGKISGFLKHPTTYATPDEITCLNEWVLKLAGENSQTAAEQ